nr:hypothetical protein GID_ORF1 [Hordeum vulgare subsp. vulgare]
MASTEKRFCRGSGETVDPGQIAWRALDLKFPREETESDWSDGDAQVLHVEDKDSSVVDGGDDDEECNGQMVDEDKNTNTKIISAQLGQYWDMCDDILDREDDDDTPLPPLPLKLFPPTTALCALDAKCYHRVYKTHDTSTTPSILGYREPLEMLQFFSMRLSSSALSYPLSVYGIFAVRDDLDQRRNYVFNCPRDAAVEILKQSAVYYAELNLACQKQCTFLAFVCEEPVELLQSPHIGQMPSDNSAHEFKSL